MPAPADLRDLTPATSGAAAGDAAPQRPADPRKWTRCDGRRDVGVEPRSGSTPVLGEDGPWAVHAVVASTRETVAAGQTGALLLMDLQDEGHALPSDLVARPGGPLTDPARSCGADAGHGSSPAASGGR